MVVDLPDITISEALKRVIEKNYEEFPEITEEESLLIKQIYSKEDDDWSNFSHLNKLKTLVLIEYYHQSEELKKFFLKDQKLRLIKGYREKIGNMVVFKNRLEIDVPFLDLEDPFVTPGDKVILDGKSLKIVEISSGLIIAESENSLYWYQENKTYDVSFQLNGYLFKCMIYALKKMFSCEEILNPDPESQPSSLRYGERQWYDLNVRNNPEQNQAVNHIISKTAQPAPYIVFGPPGTGKTATIVEAIKQICRYNPKDRVLVCTPSNTAADDITRRLISDLPDKVVRFNITSRNTKSLDKSIRHISCNNLSSRFSDRSSGLSSCSAQIVVSTLSNSMRIILENKTKFSYVFIDEAGQATEPETLIPFVLYTSKSYKFELFSTNTPIQFVLSGDHLQLSPVIQCKKVDQLLGVSFMERLMKKKLYMKVDGKYNPYFITKLINNYRSHESILTIPNKLFYENELVACAKTSCNFFNEVPIIFHEVQGTETKRLGSHSTFNQSEVETIADYLSLFSRAAKNAEIDYKKYIGIITPFKLQEKILNQKLKQMKLKSNIVVGTVQKFQGQERPIIIMSTVRSRVVKIEEGNTLGLLTNEKLFNVSLTRAQSLIIIVGNSKVLREYHSMWDELITHCENKNSIIKGNLLLKNNLIVQKSLTTGFEKIVDIEKQAEQALDNLESHLSKLKVNDISERSSLLDDFNRDYWEG